MSNVAVRASDGRRSKIRQQRQSQLTVREQIALFTPTIKAEPEFDIEDVVYTAQHGYQHIVGRYYQGDTWWYQFAGRWTNSHREANITPLLFKLGDVLKLPSGVEAHVHHIAITKRQSVLFSFALGDHRYTIYSYEQLLSANPPSDAALLQFLWRSFTGDTNKDYTITIIQSLKPTL